MLSSSKITGLSSVVGKVLTPFLEVCHFVYKYIYDEDKLNKDTAVLMVHMGHSHVMSRS